MFNHPREGRLVRRTPDQLGHWRWGKCYADQRLGIVPSPPSDHPTRSHRPLNWSLTFVFCARSDWNHRWRQRYSKKIKIVIITFVSNFLNLFLFLNFSFGKNERSLPTVRSFWKILWDQFDEFYIQVLLIFATISLVISFFSPDVSFIESLSIYIAVGFAGMIQTFCDWGKEK